MAENKEFYLVIKAKMSAGAWIFRISKNSQRKITTPC